MQTAEDPYEALKTFRAGEFDLVITDQVMADMNGEQLAAEIKAHAPHVPVILLTGFGNEDFVPEGGAGAIDLVVGKPLLRATLRAAIAEVMAKVSHQRPERN